MLVGVAVNVGVLVGVAVCVGVLVLDLVCVAVCVGETLGFTTPSPLCDKGLRPLLPCRLLAAGLGLNTSSGMPR